MSALATLGAAVLQDENPLAELIAEHGVTSVGVGLAIFAALLIGLGVGFSLLARAAEKALLGPREAGPRVFLWMDLIIAVGLYLFGMLAAGVVVGLADGGLQDLKRDVESVAFESGVVPGDAPDAAERAEAESGRVETAAPLDGGGDDSADATAQEAAASGEGDPELGYVAMFTLTAAVMGLVSAYLLIAGLARKGGAAALGLRPRVSASIPAARPITAVSRFIATVPFILAAGILLQLAYIGTEGGVPGQDVAEDIKANMAAYPVFTILMASVLIPILEEVVFRGFLLELLASRIGALGGIVLSSLVFAALHGWPALAPIFPLALALGWIKLRSGSLYGPILVHMLFNGGQVAQTYFTSIGP